MPAVRGPRKKFVHLECSACKSRNYRYTKSPESARKRLEINKFCKICGRHTRHVESG